MTEPTDHPNHRPDGTFAPNNCANPKGRPRRAMTWQDYSERVAHWRNKSNDELSQLVIDRNACRNLSSRDEGIIRQILNGDHETLNDREIGKPMTRADVFSDPEVSDAVISRENLRRKLLQDPPPDREAEVDRVTK